jgi:inner membrane protein
MGAMDNLTHSLVGAALAEAGPRDRFALATPTLILAANVPDVDVISYLIGDEFAALAWRRGITHGIPALLLWPFVVAALMLAWDGLVRRRRHPDAAPVRPGPLLALAALGAITHPALDWLNTYGMRWWLPFDGTWSYGDSVFIIDPWLWLGLGGVVFLARSRSWKGLSAWALLAVLASILVLGVGVVPVWTRILWTAGLLAFAWIRWRRPFHQEPDPRPRRQRYARVAVAGAALYVVAMTGAAAVAERGARAEAVALGLEPADVMTAPNPGQVAEREVIITTNDAYHHGTWRWGRTPRLELVGEPLPMRSGPVSVIDRAVTDARAQHFLVWSRYPYARAREVDGGWSVRFGDARYRGRGGLGGPEVRVAE